MKTPELIKPDHSQVIMELNELLSLYEKALSILFTIKLLDLFPKAVCGLQFTKFFSHVNLSVIFIFIDLYFIDWFQICSAAFEYIYFFVIIFLNGINICFENVLVCCDSVTIPKQGALTLFIETHSKFLAGRKILINW